MRYIFLVFIIILAACDSEEAVIQVPESAELVFPHKDALCTDGIWVSSTDMQVQLEWMGGINTDHFVLNIESLTSNTVYELETDKTKADVILEAGRPYAWFVKSVSSSSADTAYSETWRFYCSGKAIESHPPYPATLISPGFGDLVKPAAAYTLQWSGSDVDNDITGYKVYFGTNNPPELFDEPGNANQLNVEGQVNNIYYWQIETVDNNNHSSFSIVSQFKISD